MGEILAMAGRFRSGQLIAALEELVAAGPAGYYRGWGVAWCYGTLLEAAYSDRSAGAVPPRPPSGGQPVAGSRGDTGDPEEDNPQEELQRFDFSSLRDSKTDLAIARLTLDTESVIASGPGASVPGVPGQKLPPSPVLRQPQPFLRRESPRPQAFCAPGRIRAPLALSIGRRITDRDDPDERFFLHVLESYDEGDPLGSVTGMHDRLIGEPDQRFMLLSTRRLVVSTWLETAGPEPVFWLGRAPQFRVIAPSKLVSVGDMVWEPVPARTVMVFTRRRYEAGDA